MLEVMLSGQQVIMRMIGRNSAWKWLEALEIAGNPGKKLKKLELLGTGNF